MSDQYPQYQPPAGDGARRQQGDNDQTRRIDDPFGQSAQSGPYGQAPQYGQSPQYGDPGPTGPTGYGGQPAGQAPWTPDPGYHYQQQSTPPPPPPPYAPVGQAWTPAPPSQGSAVAASAKGFLAALFDFNFDTFITPKIIKAVYIVVTAVIGLAAAGFLLSAVLSGEPGLIVAALVGVPLVSIVYLALARMTLELYFAVVRLSEDVHERLPRQ